MFESLPVDDAAARLRAAAFAPLAAVLVTLGYLTVVPVLGRVPAALFWCIGAVLLIGTILGAVALLRIVRRERIRGRALGWLAGAVAVELFCARMFLGLTLPWL